MLPCRLDLTRLCNPQTSRPPCSVFKVVRIGLIGKDILQRLKFAVVSIFIKSSTRIGTPPTPNHQPLLLYDLCLPHLCYALDEKLDHGADLFLLDPLLFLLLLPLLRKLVGGS